MNYREIQRVLLKVFIGFLSLTALVAIFSLFGREFGQIQFKVVATTLTISAGSICGMACAAYTEKRSGRDMGRLGILMAAVAVFLVLGAVWGQIGVAEYWKMTLTAIVISVAFAHACLLRLPNLAPNYRWTQIAGVIAVGWLAVLIIFAIWGEFRGDAGFYRLIAAMSVVMVLLTLLVPICARLGATVEGPPSIEMAGGGDSLPEELVLRRIDNAVFADRAGRQYRVSRMETAPGAGSGIPGAPPA